MHDAEARGAKPEATTPGAQTHETDTRFRVMADSAPVLLWMSGLDGGCVFFNEGWLRFTGRPLERELGYGWAEGVHHEDLQRCVDTYMQSFVDRRPFRMEYRLRRGDGSYRWILDQGVPRYAPDDHFEGFIGSCIDITDLKEAQENLRRNHAELTRRTAELARSNHELEEYAYVASHDLQEPMRMVATYVSLLEERYRDNMDPEAASFMTYAVDGAKRMQELVRGLLTYARVSDDAPRSAVPADDVVAAARANLHTKITESGAVIETSSLPMVSGHRAQLVQVLQNLIENAIKFCQAPAPRVQISAERIADDWQFRVRDNGIGIAHDSDDRIFRVFQRLHTRSEYPGNGIGLSLCRKIIESHGGRIWYERNADTDGTTFLFTLPAA